VTSSRRDVIANIHRLDLKHVQYLTVCPGEQTLCALPSVLGNSETILKVKGQGQMSHTRTDFTENKNYITLLFRFAVQQSNDD